MEKCLLHHGDMDNVLADSLAHVIAGIEGADVGGNISPGRQRTCARALYGLVEELIDFVDGMESGLLLA